MKYFIGIILVLIILLYGYLWKLPLLISIVLLLLYFFILFFWEYAVLRYKISGEFQMRSYRKSLETFGFAIAIIWTLMYVIDLHTKGITNSKLPIVILFWFGSLVNIIMYFMYKKKKPVTVFITGDWLHYNNRWKKKRDLKTLNYIGTSKLATDLILGFTEKSDVIIPMKEYKKEEFRQFLDILIEKSDPKHKVYLIDNLTERFPKQTKEA
ncbi:hypothetical protein U8527_12890 [Kordia algicida OT-1]|uniref:Uncharacterized protein n=1 Tax=Kordia algicida OT-1 TaxID=391587 RepID=A9E4K4_9FLAO|nr:hypothetical protein [Kordia algicida]EDP95105.1 hypothetical protein KAOT1_06467 [Kordia algicida OT-1]